MIFEIREISREKRDFRDSAKLLHNEGRRLFAQMVEKEYGRTNVEISFNENGKPLTDFCFFNISHSGDMVACALSDREIGIDIQLRKPFKKRPKYLLFSSREAYFVNNSKDYLTAFYDLWTRKEAYIKAVGGKLCEIGSVELITDGKKPADEINGFRFSTRQMGDYTLSICEKI